VATGVVGSLDLASSRASLPLCALWGKKSAKAVAALKKALKDPAVLERHSAALRKAGRK